MGRAQGLCRGTGWHGSSRTPAQEGREDDEEGRSSHIHRQIVRSSEKPTGLSDAQITEHLDLYAGYVKQVNSLVLELAEMRAERGESGKDFSLAEGTRRLAYEYDGMVLHELYFSNLKPGGDARPSDRQPLGRALAESFGSVDHWQENFQAIGGMRGIGWVILYEDPLNGRLINQWITLHQDGIPARWNPILVMDVWEHAFMRDYKASERAKYVDAFFKNIDWSAVESRLREAAAVRAA
jgi:superoxide dismutase, Fe-Mn family